MLYELEISHHNQNSHLLIEEEMQKIQNGPFTFILRVADGNIVDTVFLSYESYKNFKEPDIARHSGEGSKED